VSLPRDCKNPSTSGLICLGNLWGITLEFPWLEVQWSWGSYGLQAIGTLGFVWVVTFGYFWGIPQKDGKNPSQNREKNSTVLTWTSPWMMDELCPARQGIVHGKPFTGSHLKVGNSCPEQGRHRHWTDGKSWKTWWTYPLLGGPANIPTNDLRQDYSPKVLPCGKQEWLGCVSNENWRLPSASPFKHGDSW